jgi:hypothetical protein
VVTVVSSGACVIASNLWYFETLVYGVSRDFGYNEAGILGAIWQLILVISRAISFDKRVEINIELPGFKSGNDVSCGLVIKDFRVGVG